MDAWLWAIRVYKTRSAATAACRAGHVRLNDKPAKAAQSVVSGDTIRVRGSGWERILEVRVLIAKRVGAEAAARCFTDHTPPRPVLPASWPAPARPRRRPPHQEGPSRNGEIAGVVVHIPSPMAVLLASGRLA